MLEISLPQARRIALAAQGFADPAHRTPTMRTLERTIARTGVFQVDSVNVLARAHLLPLYSRVGPYDPALLRRAAERRPRRLVEYWAHVQALMPVELWPVMRHRMARYRELGSHWGFTANARVVREVHAAVTERGAMTARALDHEFATGPRSREHWGWNWSDARQALDFLYRCGELAIAGRNAQFEIVYDRADRVVPAEHLQAPALATLDAHVELIRRAARSHGVATVHDLRDYYRIAKLRDARAAVDQLVERQELTPVRVRGWHRPAYLHHHSRMPRRIKARALLSPFDPVVWERSRTEALFGFRYRIEIYTPPAQRIHGYYVLPFLLGDQIVARVDLKADRAAQRLLVQASYAETGAPADLPEELAAELTRLAGWLGLTSVVVIPRGDLAGALSAAVNAATR